MSASSSNLCLSLSVVDTLRLADGTLWSIPVNLDLSREDIESKSIRPGSRVTLRDPRDDEALAILTGQSSVPGGNAWYADFSFS